MQEPQRAIPGHELRGGHPDLDHRHRLEPCAVVARRFQPGAGEAVGDHLRRARVIGRAGVAPVHRIVRQRRGRRPPRARIGVGRLRQRGRHRRGEQDIEHRRSPAGGSCAAEFSRCGATGNRHAGTLQRRGRGPSFAGGQGGAGTRDDDGGEAGVFAGAGCGAGDGGDVRFARHAGDGRVGQLRRGGQAGAAHQVGRHGRLPHAADQQPGGAGEGRRRAGRCRTGAARGVRSRSRTAAPAAIS